MAHGEAQSAVVELTAVEVRELQRRVKVDGVNVVCKATGASSGAVMRLVLGQPVRLGTVSLVKAWLASGPSAIAAGGFTATKDDVRP